MKKSNNIYWWCQVGGWLFYTLVFVFFSYAFDSKVFQSPVYFQRLGLSVILGLVFTHIMRFAIKEFKLLPPIYGKKWGYIVALVIAICCLYSIANSQIVEITKLYDAKIKATVPRRFIYNLLNDSPIFIMWALIYYVFQYVWASRNNELYRAKLETQVKELELKTIKAHINPHFIFNALNSIRALVDENPTRARTAITELSNILRSSMQADKLETTTLEKEINIVKDYLALEHIRFEDRLKVNYEIDEDTLDQLIPPMMVQTLVENAIKHGIGKQVNGGTINIIADFVKDDLEIKVQNTGQLNIEINKEGFGIASTYNRLNLLFDKKAKFELKNIEGMVEAKIIIPV